MISPLRVVDRARSEDAETRPIRAIQPRHRTAPELARNCFEFVEPVLDQLYADLGGAKADKSLARALEDLRRDLNRGDKTKINYSDPIRRFAYLYRHMPLHMYAFDQILEEEYEVRQLFNRPLLRLSSIGGGPGSDVLAALRRAARGNKRARIDATIFDRECSWQQTWDRISGVWGQAMRTDVKYRPFDMTQPLQGPMLRTVRATRLFTLSYCLSEVAGGPAQAQRFLENLVAVASRGAYFVIMDNKRGLYEHRHEPDIRWVEGWADDMRLHPVIRMKDDDIKIDGFEWSHSHNLRRKFHLDACSPEYGEDKGIAHRNLAVSYTILRKL